MRDLPLDDETLALYLDGRLTGPDLDRVHAALAADPQLQDELLQLAQVIADEPTQRFDLPPEREAALVEQAVALMAPRPSLVQLAVRWLGDQLQPLVDALQPAALPALSVRGHSVRGHSARGAAPDQREAAEELRYLITLGDLPLEIDLAAEGPGRASIFVRPLAPPPAGLMIRLSAAGQTRAMSVLTGQGAALEGLRPGAYELQLEQSDQKVAMLKVRLFAEDDPNA